MQKLLLIGLALVTGFGVVVFAAERGPITITSDSDFTAENGVIAGNGTPEDPYIISGWQIQVPQGGAYGVRIEGTQSHFILRGLKITGALDPKGAAIYLADVQNGTIEDCVVQNSQNGIALLASHGIAIRDTYMFVAGIGLQVSGTSREHYEHSIESTNLVNGKPVYYYFGLQDQTLEGLEAGHITLAGCKNVILRGAKVEDGDGITVAFSEDIVVEKADLFRNHSHGLFVLSSPRTVVRDCERIANSALSGVSIWLSPRSQVLNSGIHANQVGLYINASDRVLAQGNTYIGDSVGVRIAGASREVEILDSSFFQNRNAIELDTAFGPRIERCAFVEGDVGVYVDSGTTYAAVHDCTMVVVGYGISNFGSQGTFEDNLITRANIGIIFEEAYGEAHPTSNTVRHNVIYRSRDGLYFGHESTDTWIYENLIWKCDRAARDFGKNRWAPYGRGNWYSNYSGQDADGDGIGDEPVTFGGGGVDPAPLMSRDFYTRLPGLVATFEPRTITLVDETGNSAEITVRVADQAHERFLGFQGIPTEIAQDLAILFVWDEPDTRRFWNPNVFISLDLLFFSGEGDFLGDLTMPPDTKDFFASREPFQWALELPEGKLAELGLSTPVRLVLP